MSGLAKATGYWPNSFPSGPRVTQRQSSFCGALFAETLDCPISPKGALTVALSGLPDALLVCCCPLVLSVGTGSGSLSSQLRRCLFQEGTLGFRLKD